ncbi:MAG: hypothetical protein C5B51_21640 [Terriglobia bacterium]|nr:MAG: hypothetical protein C5B51_21640 [Terriglobia bacterium]
MGEALNRSLAFQRVLAPATARLKQPPVEGSDQPLDVAVVFTSSASTIAALRKAAALVDRLSTRIKLLVPQVVPYPRPLESPPVLLDFSEQRFHEIAAECPAEIIVQIYLCRDRAETLKDVLAARSLVVIGAHKTWWPTREKRLARTLRRAGHEVIVTEME